MRKMCIAAVLGSLLWATPSVATQSDQPKTVIASYYQHGARTANGERYNPDGLTAAHKTLPFGTKVKVTNESNGKTVVVRINDRGPFTKGRTIDLSRGAAKAIGMIGSGVARVTLEIL
jgi:rare lipoprotein A